MASASALLAELHGIVFRPLTLEIGDRDGLTVAAREARRRGMISPNLAKKLERLDVSVHFAQHINAAKVLTFQERLERELSLSAPAQREDPWMVGPDPWSSPGASQGAIPRDSPAVAPCPASVASPACSVGHPIRVEVVETGTQVWEPLPLRRSIGVVTSRPGRVSRGTFAGFAPDAPLPSEVVTDDGSGQDPGMDYDPVFDEAVTIATIRERCIAELELALGDLGEMRSIYDTLPLATLLGLCRAATVGQRTSAGGRLG